MYLSHSHGDTQKKNIIDSKFVVWQLDDQQLTISHCPLLAKCYHAVLLTNGTIIGIESCHYLFPSLIHALVFVFFQNCLIRLTSRGREALVTDFGLAREVVELQVQDQSRKLSLVGSAFWMAPEMLRGEPYDRKVN